ncbi:hypothetical protein PCE1_002878 [Barthelona sp. PCE]
MYIFITHIFIAFCFLLSFSRMKLAVLLLSVLLVAQARNFAVLIAGSKGWNNYRHQSDVMAHYQLLKARGYKKEDMIVFAYDDIAYNSYNPKRGKIFNRADLRTNVYDASAIDYRGADANPKIILDVIAGRSVSVGSRRTVPAGVDKLYIYYNNHGYTDLIAAPASYQGKEYIYSWDFDAAIKKAPAKTVFGNIEACYSGSMFYKTISNKTGSYAFTTAANVAESSYAAVWSSTLRAYLSNEYSKNLMDFIGGSSTLNFKLVDMYKAVKDKTEGSHVSKYGPSSIFNLKGLDIFKPKRANSEFQVIPSEPIKAGDRVKVTELRQNTMQRALLESQVENDLVQTKILESQMKADKAYTTYLDSAIEAIANMALPLNKVGDIHKDVQEMPVTKRAVFEATLDKFTAKCGSLVEHGWGRIEKLHNVARIGNVEDIVKAIEYVCQ